MPAKDDIEAVARAIDAALGAKTAVTDYDNEVDKIAKAATIALLRQIRSRCPAAWWALSIDKLIAEYEAL